MHYLRQTDQHPHDILLCIGTGKSVSDEKRLKYHGDQFFLKTADEMAAVFGDYPEALTNTVRIAERCNVKLPKGEAHLPDFAVPAGYTADSYFEHVVRAGLCGAPAALARAGRAAASSGAHAEYEARLAYEIDVIRQMKYPGYFLIVWDFIRYARERGIPVGPGRGRPRAASWPTACGSLTSIRSTSTCTSSAS